MLFNSLQFVAFCIVVFVLYYLPPLKRYQPAVLIVASFYFYAANDPILLVLLLSSIAINAVTSFLVATRPMPEQVRWAIAGVVANLALLGFFKYAGLFARIIAYALHASHAGVVAALLSVPLPIGISFYTFEGISLLVDVLRARRGIDIPTQPAARSVNVVAGSLGRHLYNTSLFIAFFPHLVAGPILKAWMFYPQIGVKHFKDIPWVVVVRTLILGYFFKMVIADNLKDFTTVAMYYPYYESGGTITNGTLLIGYSMQIFADFAGYSAIAIGVAAAFGYSLPQNFNRPYRSASLAEFWTRWHISLSSWLRDYLYISLGGNRKGALRTYVNLFVVMLLGGLWHGAAMQFVVWGGYHGLGLAVERFFTRGKSPIRGRELPWVFRATRTLAVFSFVSVGWLFFRLPAIRWVIGYLKTLTRIHVGPSAYVLPVLLYCVPVIVYHFLQLEDVVAWRERLKTVKPSTVAFAECAAYAAMLCLIVVNSGSPNAFIYFQF